jgi:hypothetical protein
VGFGSVLALASAPRGRAEWHMHTSSRLKWRQPEAASGDMSESYVALRDVVVHAELEGRDCAEAATRRKNACQRMCYAATRAWWRVLALIKH